MPLYVSSFVAFPTPVFLPALPSKMSVTPQDDDSHDLNKMSELDAWAERMEGVWNEVLQADSRRGKPRVTLPGFPIHVRERKTSHDMHRCSYLIVNE